MFPRGQASLAARQPWANTNSVSNLQRKTVWLLLSLEAEGSRSVMEREAGTGPVTNTPLEQFSGKYSNPVGVFLAESGAEEVLMQLQGPTAGISAVKAALGPRGGREVCGIVVPPFRQGRKALSILPQQYRESRAVSCHFETQINSSVRDCPRPSEAFLLSTDSTGEA